jgi:hypothetical protein
VLACVLLVDRLVLGEFGPWASIDCQLGDCGPQCRVIRNKAFAERELAALHAADPESWRVLVVGSSRAGAGFVPHLLPRADPMLAKLYLAKVAIAATEPYTMRSLATRLGRNEVDEVVLFLSEFDTHRPFFLVPTVGFGGVAAWIDLVRVTSPRFAWRHREALMRLALASSINTYRHRDVLQALGRNYLLGTVWDEVRNESDNTQIGVELVRNALAAPPPLDRILPWDEFQRVSEQIQSHFPEPTIPGPLRQLRTVSFGSHVELQKALVRATVEAVIRRGARISIVEAPIHPLGEWLYDLETRKDFRAFAGGLASDPRIEIVELAQLPPFTKDEFRDLTHLNDAGAERLTRHVVDRLARHAGDPSHPPLP